MIAFAPIRHWLRLSVVAAILLAPLSASAGMLDIFDYMRNWEPSTFEMACGDEDGPYRPESRGFCMSDEERTEFEVAAGLALQEYRRKGFSHPRRLGPVIDGIEDSYPAIRIFAEPALGGAAAQLAYRPSGLLSNVWCDFDANHFIRVSSNFLSFSDNFVIGTTAAHEVFHSVQAALPEAAKRNVFRYKECFPPRWILEGQADAAAIKFARSMYSSIFPLHRRNAYYGNYAGLRPYYIPLNYRFPESKKHFSYQTSSFWRHLSDVYHGGRIKFLKDYATAPAPAYTGGKEDWLYWLDDRLKNDPRIKTPLYLVYPGFLTHFAGQWVGDQFVKPYNQDKWLTKVFGGCATATVSPLSPYIEVPVEKLYPMSGRCLKVTITGISDDDLVAVKIGALEHEWEIVDSLHLGLASSNDQTGFNCARRARTYQPAPGMAGCLFEPVTGSLGQWTRESRLVRMWNASTLEKGPGAQRAAVVVSNDNASTSAGIENVYVLSYVPRLPFEQLLEDKEPVTVWLGIGLEWSSLTVAGTSVNQGSADGKRSATRHRAIGAVGQHALEADMMVPPSTGWIDDQGMDSIMSGGLLDMISEARRIGSETARQRDPAGTAQNVQVFSLADAIITPFGAGSSEEQIEVWREFHVRLDKPLPAGATGSFPVGIFGQDRAHNLQYFTQKIEDATMTITENSSDAFQASVTGTVCVADLEVELRRRSPSFRCPHNVEISGRISKPFNYLYQVDTQLVAIETEGEKAYNRYGPSRRIRELLTGDGGSGAGGGGGGGGAGGGGAGGGGNASTSCACDCPQAASASTATCQAQCAPEWARCQMAAAPEDEAPSGNMVAPLLPTPTIKAQRKWFSRLVRGNGLTPEVEQMLVDDFATMSDETRKYLIRQYRNGVN